MLVYGDRSEMADADERLGALRDSLAGLARMAAGLDRHAKLVAALIEAGRVLQGVADGEGETTALFQLVQQLAQCVVQSWDSGFAGIGELPSIQSMELPR